MKKQLVIINGVTGAIGSALLEKFGQEKSNTIIGTTRSAKGWSNFVCQESNFLFDSSFFCSVGFVGEEIAEFIKHIDFEKFSRIVYIHCVGAYLFEIDSAGKFFIENDEDGDGINDIVMMLSYNVFKNFSKNLTQRASGHVDCVIFGGLADRHEPRIIQSWWRTMQKTESLMHKMAADNTGMFKFDISSVLCPHELLSRPFVFTQTNADQSAWLSPSMLASEVIRTLGANRNGGFHKNDVFRRWEGFSSKYYTDQQMVPRRLLETTNNQM